MAASSLFPFKASTQVQEKNFSRAGRQTSTQAAEASAVCGYSPDIQASSFANPRGGYGRSSTPTARASATVFFARARDIPAFRRLFSSSLGVVTWRPPGSSGRPLRWWGARRGRTIRRFWAKGEGFSACSRRNRRWSFRALPPLFSNKRGRSVKSSICNFLFASDSPFCVLGWAHCTQKYLIKSRKLPHYSMLFRSLCFICAETCESIDRSRIRILVFDGPVKIP